jgi:hypothetical protein
MLGPILFRHGPIYSGHLAPESQSLSIIESRHAGLDPASIEQSKGTSVCSRQMAPGSSPGDNLSFRG